MPFIENGENPHTGLRGLASMKAAKLEEINACFAAEEQTGFVMTSLGFAVNANDVANRNVEGLIKVLAATGQAETLFCDYNNAMQQVTLEQLKAIQLEIIAYGQQIYAKKWLLREAVQAAASAEEVQAIVWGNM